MMKKLLIIKTGNTIASLRSKGEDFEDWFIAGAGLEPDQALVSSLFMGQPLPALEKVSGIIITGSPAYITDLKPWNQVGADYLRQAVDKSLPVLAVCYGHQLLAWAFGGEVDFHPGGREIGSVEIELTGAGKQDRLLGSLPPRFTAQVSHQQSVLRLPADAVRLAQNDFDPNHGFRLGETAWGLQFHPEFTADISAAYIRERAADLQAEGLDSEALLQALQPSPEAAALLGRFAGLCRQEAS
jgi:GMP synthase (glutamine-hydrolysing)